MFRLYRPDFHIRILLFDGFSYSGNGTAGADAGTESMDGAVCLLQNLNSGPGTVHCRIGGIFKLLRYKHSWIFSGHGESFLEALFDTCANIPGVMNQNHLCSVMFHQLTSFFTDRIRHNNFCLISPYCSYQRQANALIAAGGLHNNGIFFNQAFFFRILYHIVSGSCLDGTSHIQPFKFHQHLSAFRLCHVVQTN